MERDLIQLFEAAKKAADTANTKGILLGQAEASRCIDALSKLKTFRVSRRVLEETRIDQRLERLSKHKNRSICSAASTLLQQWRQTIRNEERQDSAAVKKPIGRKTQGGGLVIRLKLPTKVASSSSDSDQKGRCVPFTALVKGKDDSRSRIRDMVAEALSRVYEEVKVEDLKEKLRQCNPIGVASAVEVLMFEKMGPINGKMKHRYRSIMFNLRDLKNPDLRKNVLLGQVTPEKLVDMRTEEMASDKIKADIHVLRKRALQREDEMVRMVDDTSRTVQEECFDSW